jgi:hypothetical protein
MIGEIMLATVEIDLRSIDIIKNCLPSGKILTLQDGVYSIISAFQNLIKLDSHSVSAAEYLASLPEKRAAEGTQEQGKTFF